MSTERPILFSAPMVRALLAGTKTQTRRLVKPQPGEANTMVYPSDSTQAAVIRKAWKPYALPGDRLWVKETFATLQPTEHEETARAHRDRVVVRPEDDERVALWYRADGEMPFIERLFSDDEDSIRWRPSIYMPRWASRITLEVTSVRVERLQAITEADAIAEGIELSPGGPWRAYDAEGGCCYEAVESFRTLWQSINGAESWAANPWVWVVEFKRVTP